jgi:hypothetical protein
MPDILSEAESLCQQVLDILPSMKLSNEATLIASLQTAVKSICVSRRKIMVRSAKGQELATEIASAAANLYHAASAKESSDISRHLEQLEAPVKKLEIFWRSFEYATT